MAQKTIGNPLPTRTFTSILVALLAFLAVGIDCNAVSATTVATATGTITGKVVDVQGVGLAGVRASAFWTAFGDTYSAITNAQGNFSITGVPLNHTYDVGFSLSGYAGRYFGGNGSGNGYTNVYTVVLDGSHTSRAIGASVLAKEAIITGRVLDTNGNPITGMRVEDFYVGSGVQRVDTTYTDSAGMYRLGGLVAGRHTTCAGNACTIGYTNGSIDETSPYSWAWFGNVGSQEQSTSFAVAAGRTASGKDIVLPKSAMISGTFTNSQNGNALVRIWAETSRGTYLPAWYAILPNNGVFSFKYLRPGSYKLSFVGGATQYWSGASTIENAQLVTVTAGQARTGVDALDRSNFFSSAPVPVVSGTCTVGSQLVANAGTWSPEPSSVAYRWKRNGVTIVGEKSPSYTLQSADVGKNITVEVRANRSGHALTIRTSDPTVRISAG